ncbi:hypothetical protein [Endozoicomonas atrinae]|uniref:hypothetical protein n=1 Tax=Endozoicomonas atrinae TaxID=1333660 RepID=UPI00082568A7|nr:hypothetical protein [Endozoicomonas atrinae]
MADFLDIGLSDILGAYVSVESEKAQNSLDSFKQGQAQAAAMLDAEKVSQTTETKDVLDDIRAPSLFSGMDQRLLYVGGGLLLLGIGYAVMKK